jgi:hypothetical protein
MGNPGRSCGTGFSLCCLEFANAKSTQAKACVTKIGAVISASPLAPPPKKQQSE